MSSLHVQLLGGASDIDRELEDAFATLIEEIFEVNANA